MQKCNGEPNMIIGAHISISGGYTNALKRIYQIGGNCLQIFSSSPRDWNSADVSKERIDEFVSVSKKLRIFPIYFHASYLLNLASEGRIADLSKNILVEELGLAAKMGIKGSVIHLGSFKKNPDGSDLSTGEKNRKYNNLIGNIAKVLSKTPSETLFIIENAGTRKIGKNMKEIGNILTDVADKRVRVCLDTCHLHAAGYDLADEKNMKEFWDLFDDLVGLDQVELMHANDSKDEFGRLRDRHENIGKGKVGIKTFVNILNHPQLGKLPFILETPGFDDKGPDKKNLDILKGLYVG